MSRRRSLRPATRPPARGGSHSPPARSRSAAGPAGARSRARDDNGRSTATVDDARRPRPLLVSAIAGLVLVAMGAAWWAYRTPPAHAPGLETAAATGSATPRSDDRGAPPAGPSAPARPAEPTAPERLRVEVIDSRPHDATAFTQGLVLHEGVLYESTGLYGQSTLRTVDPVTGDVLKKVDMAPHLFAEGLALVGDRLVQLTWREGVAPVYDRATLSELEQFAYEGEGWGLCHDGSRLVMSDGSSRLTFRDPITFDATGSISVTLAGQPLYSLNELECVEGLVWANVWQTDTIVAIDPGSGQVRSIVNAAGLLSPQEDESADVLNGIAHDPSRGTYLITGKLWPRLFEVRFVPETRATAFLPELLANM